MTKSELIQKLADKFDLQPRHARLIVDAVFENMSRALILGDKVILRGFGTFSQKVSKARQSRNPQTGEKIQIGDRRGIVFKAGRALHDRLNHE